MRSLLGFILLMVSSYGVAWAQGEVLLSGTLKTINDRGSILIGYRDSAAPFHS
jgi:hypothetical protein